MHRTSPLGLTDATASEPEVVASLVVDSAVLPDTHTPDHRPSGQPASRALIHLARMGGSSATPGYALGIPASGHWGWHPVGETGLDASATARVLLAGLSVLAMKHVREADIQIGDAVLVVGADPWSLLLLQWARLQGAAPLVFARRGPQPLDEYASSAGADAVLSDPAPGDLARAIAMTHRSAGFAVVLDAITNEQSVTRALPALRDGGRYVLAGLDAERYVSLNAYPDLHRRDLEIISPVHSNLEPDFVRFFRFSLKLVEEGRLHLNDLLDPTFGWGVRMTNNML